ncbi:hypothetical protein EUGRSUZ_K03297 [Eucalyptus grandis]|uniref:Uncharacterized protein n=2 Tax=Eucalyptus grandis TaxID=71139 RepID=A0ACC3J0R9_EUCGR|nr:hypothetical protein EUGRSUZ_K03297 [Eucalyptus grandis]
MLSSRTEHLVPLVDTDVVACGSPPPLSVSLSRFESAVFKQRIIGALTCPKYEGIICHWKREYGIYMKEYSGFLKSYDDQKQANEILKTHQKNALFFFKPSPPRPPSSSSSKNLPRVYPIGTADLIRNSPSSATYVFHRPLSHCQVITGNPANVQHILKTHFGNYEKGGVIKTTFRDLLGDGIFNVSSHEFKIRSLRKFFETVVDAELKKRLLPLLAFAAKSRAVMDMQDILQRFAFDNICKIAFGYDAEYLSPSLPQPSAKFAEAFEDAVKISTERLVELLSVIRRIKRFFNIGSKKRLQELSEKSSIAEDLLSQFLSSGYSNVDFVIDIVISFILTGRDTTSAALTWYFWLLHKNPELEAKIWGEIMEKSDAHLTGYDDVKEMVYTHASLCESIRIYPPVPLDTREAVRDDVLEDGTVVKKGTWVTYHPYAMGRLEELWGKDWPEFRPERWLKAAEDGGEKWVFLGRDMICLGKDMAFLQMKRVVAGVLRQFKVVPAEEEGAEPVFHSYLASKRRAGFPVRIEVRE